MIYLKNNSNLNDVLTHLHKVNNEFIPPLSEVVDLEKYSKKIFEYADRIEIWEKNILIGLIAYYVNFENQNVFITNVSLEKDFHGKKIAEKLFEVFEKEIVKIGLSNIILEVNKDNNKAIKFYHKLNFNKIQVKNENLIMQKIVKEMDSKRDYNKELKDTEDHKYAYNFDFDVMHHFMLESFKPFFKDGNFLELGSFKGDFTKRFTNHFDDITCVEASDEAISIAKTNLPSSITFINSLFEEVNLPKKYDNIVLTHVLEHLDDPVKVLKRINDEWLSDTGRFFLVCPNANAPSRQIAVKMGLITHNDAITPAEKEHGHHITYTLDTLERDAKAAGLNVVFRTGIFFKALANFQWDRLLQTDIISKEYLQGCYELGHHYPDLCSSIFIMCEKGK